MSLAHLANSRLTYTVTSQLTSNSSQIGLKPHPSQTKTEVQREHRHNNKSFPQAETCDYIETYTVSAKTVNSPN